MLHLISLSLNSKDALIFDRVLAVDKIQIDDADKRDDRDASNSKIIVSFMFCTITVRNICSYETPGIGRMNRSYLYVLDLHGKLYLHDMIPKNIATSYKDEKFLKFFFKRLEFNDTNRHPEYPMISKCGPELNYLKSVELLETPFVFTHCDFTQISGLYKSLKFDPEDLMYSMKTNKLYYKHRISMSKLNALQSSSIRSNLNFPEFGVVDDQLILSTFMNARLGNNIIPETKQILIDGVTYKLKVQ